MILGSPSSKGTRQAAATVEAAGVRQLYQSLWEGHSKGQGWQRDKGQQDGLRVSCMPQLSCQIRWSWKPLESHSISFLLAQQQ